MREAGDHSDRVRGGGGLRCRCPGAEAPGLQRDGVAVSADATRVVTPPGWGVRGANLGSTPFRSHETDAQANDVGLGWAPTPSSGRR